ncbi:TetR family transcriptional regulator [Actinobacteria bacterium YIM 96077]|uniref:TetR/AcrR family transcriptional regulator n=2 Tax=Phytoactinopolyspora halophila TaxID=1981511 RepID=A0A329QL15_9ACTN|nr:TetR family transcriptional regulator [Actinobacteria bacterium YIM 96077]RAW12581.1 TetR/AcrR family transcriptional regulator [Phytoactinopolyspora halophila]
MRHGYLGTSVDDVAAEARVSKRTIYNLFGGKEELFRAILAEALITAERFASDTASSLAEADDVPAELRATAVRLARSVVGGRIVPLRRLLIAEATRFPELAADYYSRAPGRVMATLAEALRHLDERGALRVDDAELAAEHFAFLVMGAQLDRALFTIDQEPPAITEIDDRALRGVETFLRAYGPTG